MQRSVPNHFRLHITKRLPPNAPASKCTCLDALNIYLKHPPSDHTVVKVDFRNIFSSICKILTAFKEYIPDLIQFAHSSYSSPLILMWNYMQWKAFCNVTLWVVPCCSAWYPEPHIYQLCHLQFNVVYFDEGTIGGKFEDLQADLRLIEDQGNALGLILNVDKSELIYHSNLTISTRLMSAFPGLPATTSNRVTHLGHKQPSQLTRMALGSEVPPILHSQPFWHLLMESPTLLCQLLPTHLSAASYSATGPGLVYMEGCLAFGLTLSHCHKFAEVLVTSR